MKKVKQLLTGAVLPFMRSPGGLFLFFYAALLYCEVLLRADTAKQFSGIGLLYIALFSIPAAALFTLVSSLGSRRVNRVLAALCTVFITILYISQCIYYHIFYTHYVTYSAVNGGQVIGFWEEIVFTVYRNWGVTLAFFAPLVLMLALSKWVFGHGKLGKRNGFKLLGGTVCAHVLAVLLLFVGGTQQFSPYDLYFRTVSLDYSVNKLGLLTAMRLDAKRLIFGFDGGAVYGSKNLDAPIPVEIPGEEESGDKTPQNANMMAIPFGNLAGATEDEEVRKLHEYFDSLTPSSKNDHTGIFAGKNLVFITAESFSPYCIDPELTPALYKLSSQGYQFENFYTPLWGVSTSDGEYTTTMGLLPKQGVWSFYNSSNNFLPFTLAHQFGREGYLTNAYHNHDNTYYKRNESHPNVGYNFKAVGNGLEISDLWPESDLEMVDVSTGEYTGQEPFFVYYLTVSAHMPYSTGGNDMADKNYHLVEDLPYSEEVKCYLAASIELDRAVGLLMDRLEEAGAMDDTVLVLTADHYPYGLPADKISEMAGHEVDEDFEIFRNGLYIYTPGIEREVITEPCTTVDILPTLSNLFGFTFDSRLLMGRDVFSDAPPLVILANRSWITDKGRYNTATAMFTPEPGAEIPEGYQESVSAVVDNKMSASAKIQDLDYYRILFGEEQDAPPEGE